jgi:hypothetical protein
MKKRRTEITVETDRMLLIIRPGKTSLLPRCERCGERVEMVTVDQAAMLAGVGSRTIFHWVEVGRLHSSETAEGLLLVCLNSLFE